MLSGILSCARRNLRRQQSHDRAVFIGRPNGSIAAQETGSRTLFPTEAEGSVEQSRRKPFEANRSFVELAAHHVYDTIDHVAADQRFAHCGARGPLRTMRKQ